jgi:hypothetical protein
VGKTELNPKNQAALEVLIAVSPSMMMGFSLQAVIDAAEILDIDISRAEVRRILAAYNAATRK